MTRDALVAYITEQTQQLQPNDVTACQDIVSTQYEIIYNQELWKDSLTIVGITFDPVNNPDNASGVILLPQQIDRIVAARTNCNSIRVNNLENYYRVDFDAFTANNSNIWGSAAEFAILYPIWTAIGPATPQLNPVSLGSYSDNLFGPNGTILIQGTGITNGTLISLKAGPNELSLSGTMNFALVNGTTYIFALPGVVSINGPKNQPFTGTLGAFLPGAATESYGPGATFTLASSVPADSAKNVKIVWRDRHEQFVQTTHLPITLTPPDGLGFVEIAAMFMDSGITGTITLTVNSPSISGVDASGNPTAITFSLSSGKTIAPGVQQTPKYQRMRIFSIPSVVTQVFVLGKKPFTPLDFGSEVPAIKNIDQCLIAFGMARMLERARQFGKAQQKLTEAGALLKQLAILEAVQAANHEQFKPDGGFGDAFFSPRGIGYNGGIF